MEKRINVKGIHCEHCIARIEKALHKIEGVTAKADLKGVIVKMANEVSEEELTRAIKEAGYEVE